MLFFPSLFSQNHLNVVLVNNVPLFFNIRDGPYMPTLRLLHQCKVFLCLTVIYYWSLYHDFEDEWPFFRVHLIVKVIFFEMMRSCNLISYDQ